MARCDVCNRQFINGAEARRHKRATKHCVCRYCGKITASSEDLREHHASIHEQECPQCQAIFTIKLKLLSHQKKKLHCYCGDCDKPFLSASALESHLQSSQHSTEFRCCDCDRNFKSSRALEQHLSDKIHRRPGTATRKPKKSQALVDAQSDTWCAKCQRRFKTASDLQKHKASLVHHPLGSITCIAGSSCGKKFPSPSAMLHHLESGVCPCGINRDKLNRMIMDQDTDRIITCEPQDSIHPGMLTEVNNKLRLMSHSEPGSPGTPGSSGVLIKTPTSDMDLSDISELGCWTPEEGSLVDWALLISESGQRCCPFCPHRRPFPTLQGLRDHLQSAAHSKPFVHCPAGLMTDDPDAAGAVRSFTTVSGLTQHLESGACVGGATGFWKAVKYLEKRLKTLGLDLKMEAPRKLRGAAET